MGPSHRKHIRIKKILDRHGVMSIGYSNSLQRFIIRNSWGDKWAMKGHLTMPYPYATDTNLADGFWAIREIDKLRDYYSSSKES